MDNINAEEGEQGLNKLQFWSKFDQKREEFKSTKNNTKGINITVLKYIIRSVNEVSIELPR